VRDYAVEQWRTVMRTDRPKFDYKFLSRDELEYGITEIEENLKRNLDYADLLEKSEVREPADREARRQYIQSILDDVDDDRQQIDAMKRELATRA
jgi:hypothetical protein